MGIVANILVKNMVLYNDFESTSIKNIDVEKHFYEEKRMIYNFFEKNAHFRKWILVRVGDRHIFQKNLFKVLMDMNRIDERNKP